METIHDFEDILFFLEKHHVRYLIIGGMAFIFHAKPRYTKDIDFWIDPGPANVEKANKALTEFGSPFLLTLNENQEILQIGVAPDRMDFFRHVIGAKFETAWKNRIRAKYGRVDANWIDINSLIRIKSKIDAPKHQEDARVLREVRKMIAQKKHSPKKDQ
jgi:hypothetical protein